MKYQHHTPSKEELIQIIDKELSKSSNWVLRRTFIVFCKYAIMYTSKEFFKKYFLKDYILSSTDRVSAVRMEFANAYLVIKPYFENEIDL